MQTRCIPDLGRPLTDTLKSLIRLSLSLGLMGLFLYLAFSGTPTDQLWHTLSGASPLWIAAMVAMTLGTVALRAWRWTVLLRPSAPQVRVWDASVALAICYAANIVIPRSGEAARAVSLRWSRQAPIGASLATVVVERILDMVILALFVGVAMALLQGRLEATYPWIQPAAAVCLVGCAALLCGLVLAHRHREATLSLARRLMSPLSKRLAARMVDLIDTFLGGLAALRNRSAYLEILASSCLLNAGYVTIVYGGFRACDLAAIAPVGWTAALVVMAVSSIGVVVPTPGGTGSYHLFFSQSLLLFGVPGAAALACATLVHAMATLLYLALGGPGFLYQRHRAARAVAVHDSGEPPVQRCSP